MFNPPHFSSDSRNPELGPPRARNTGEAAINELQFEIERLRIISEALWRILKEKHGLEENELIRQITLIDLADGKLDARVAPTPPHPCPKCQRTLAKHRPRCLFCGEPIAADPFQR